MAEACLVCTVQEVLGMFAGVRVKAKECMHD